MNRRLREAFALRLFFLLNAATIAAVAAPAAFPARSPFLERTDAPSLSDLLSSPERYAYALNMTVDQVVAAKRAHDEASYELHLKMQSSDLSGGEKHVLQCEHRFRHGRHPFVCGDCWSYRPVCVCHRFPRKIRLPENLEVVVWTHHGEWGLTSNTGRLLARTLTPCETLMKGLPRHDERMERLLRDDGVLPVVLWPSPSGGVSTNGGSRDSDPDAPPPPAVSIEELRGHLAAAAGCERSARRCRRVVLVAIDGTWRNARRMVARLPRSAPRLDLPEDVVFPEGGREAGSVLSPLRTRGPGTSGRQVCTAEAVVRALVALGLPEDDGERVLDVTKMKVDLIRRYRGKALR